MRIRFFGATRTVTGTCHCVEAGGTRILLDFGLFQGRREEAAVVNARVPATMGRVDAVVLSHGHLDHCGRLPMLARRGFRGPVFATPATIDVARIVLMDAAHIQEEDARYLNRRSPGHDSGQGVPIKPLFTAEDVERLLPLFRPVGYGVRTEIARDLHFTFWDAGHILGSAYVVLEEGGTRLLFTGDVGRYGTPIIRDPAEVPGEMDAVISESTYGTVKHAPQADVEPNFIAAIGPTLAAGGRVVLPSFAVGRTQTILLTLHRAMADGRLPKSAVFVDSPMGVEVSSVFERHREVYDSETLAEIGTGALFGTGPVVFAKSPGESMAINKVSGPAAIIASSPTCEFGRVLHHLKQSVERPGDAVVFCGWTPPGTLGRRLQDGATRVRIFDRMYDVRCAVKTVHGMSAHADGDELLKFLAPARRADGRTAAYVVHGEADRADGFAARLAAAGFAVAGVPAYETAVVVGDAPAGAVGGVAVESDEG